MSVAVRYLVSEVGRSVAFYVEYLGFDLEEQKGTAFARIRRADLVLWLSGPASSAARPMPDGRQPVAGGWNRFVIEVDDLAAQVAAMTAAGVTFRNTIVSGPGGMQILAEDPTETPLSCSRPEDEREDWTRCRGRRMPR